MLEANDLISACSSTDSSWSVARFASGVGVRIVPHGYTDSIGVPFHDGRASVAESARPIRLQRAPRLSLGLATISSNRTIWNDPGYFSEAIRARSWTVFQVHVYLDKE